MALVRIPQANRTIDQQGALTSFLAEHDIEYERWESSRAVPSTATADEVLLAYADKVGELKARGGYTTADVIDVKADTPNLDAMLAKFSREVHEDRPQRTAANRVRTGEDVFSADLIRTAVAERDRRKNENGPTRASSDRIG